MTTRMHPKFAELFLDPPDDLSDEVEARRARAPGARRQAVRASSRRAQSPADAARPRG